MADCFVTTPRPGARPASLPSAYNHKLALISTLAHLRLDPIVGNADAVDIRNTAAHVDSVLAAVGVYINAVAADLAGRCVDADTLPAIDTRAIARALDNIKIFIVGELRRPAGEA